MVKLNLCLNEKLEYSSFFEGDIPEHFPCHFMTGMTCLGWDFCVKKNWNISDLWYWFIYLCGNTG